MNICQAGHHKHDTKVVTTEVGGLPIKLTVFDWDKYQGFKGYCTGQDDISRTILNTGIWEPLETALALEILSQPDEGIVLDFGAHIGWYTILAARHSRGVVAIEGDAENLETLEHNAYLNQCADNIKTVLEWVDAKSKPVVVTSKVQLMKCDLEGNDIHAVKMCADLFKQRLIKYALVEISPCFNNTYPELIDFITGFGYDVYYAEGELSSLRSFDGKYEFDQSNFLFVRQDVL